MTLHDRMELASLFDSLAADARTGDITGAFIVIRACDGSYDSCFKTDDFDDLILQVRTEVIRAQLPPEPE